ncbi:MAG: C39 family peptidase [Clostridia bacterium]|nr:C39 family peptidase [Clostridia bacterium]
MKRTAVRALGALLAFCVLSALFVFPSRVSAATEGIPANLPFYYVQCDSRWADVKVGSLTIAQSACGITGICNAVYFLNGREMDLVAVARKAHDKHYYNTDSVAGVYRSVFKHSADWYGSEYGYDATEFLWESVKGSKLLDHIAAGGPAVLHVPGHFMTLVDYDAEKGLYLVIDSMPGDVGRYDNRRKGITHSGGDWLTLSTLQTGNTKVDGYVLFSRVLADDEAAAVLPTAVRGLTRGLNG